MEEREGVGTVLRSNVDRFGAPPPEIGWTQTRYPVAPPNPSVSDTYSHAWQQLKAEFWPLFLVGVIWVLFESLRTIVSTVLQNRAGQEVAAGFELVTNLLFSMQLGVGLYYAYLRAARGERPDVGDLFVPFRRAFLTTITGSLLYILLVVLGIILLIVPGLVLAVRLSFYPYLLVDEELGPVEAMRESWRRTTGYGWTVFGVSLLGIPIVLLGLLALIVGIIPAIMLVQLANASLYYAISARTAPRRA